MHVTTTYANAPFSPVATDTQYHPNGARQSQTTTLNGVAYPFTYRYDGAGRAISLTNPFGKTVTWRYRANGKLDRQILGNRAWTAYQYDAKGQLTGLVNRDPKGHLLSKFSDLLYDGAGKCKHLTAHVPGVPNLSGETTYTYKPGQSQLARESSTRHGAFAYNFDYDTYGNPTIFRNVAQGTYANNQIPGAGFVYDATTGNPTTYKGATLTYDQQNRLTSYNGNNFTAGYLTDGRRAWKQVNGQRTYFVYDGDTLLAEMNAQGQVTAVNTVGPTGLLARNDLLNHKETWYTFDTQGNVAQRLDATGQVFSSDLYDAWGKRLEGSDTTDPYGYKGKYGYYTDHETGLILCTHRYYDPDTGRWLTQDPIGYSGGMNLYGYCGNDPVNKNDPSGKVCGIDDAIVGGAILAIGALLLDSSPGNCPGPGDPIVHDHSSSRMVFDITTGAIFGPLVGKGLGFLCKGGFMGADVVLSKSAPIAYHAVVAESSVASVARGINRKYFKVDNRFLGGFYCASELGTAAIEASQKEAVASAGLGFELDLTNAKVLDLTNAAVAKQWGFSSESTWTTCQQIAELAKSKGIDVIKFPSFQVSGTVNYVVYNNFESILKPIYTYNWGNGIPSAWGYTLISH